MAGFFDDGRRRGEFRVETFRHRMRVLIGNYERDQVEFRRSAMLTEL